MVDVLKLKPLGKRRLWHRFTDGWEGVCDLGDFVESGGPMVEPLRDDDYFARVFVEMGAPTCPNGLDLDPINLYMEMKAQVSCGGSQPPERAVNGVEGHLRKARFA
jgi:Protein of unknown function (DUF2442)